MKSDHHPGRSANIKKNTSNNIHIDNQVKHQTSFRSSIVSPFLLCFLGLVRFGLVFFLLYIKSILLLFSSIWSVIGQIKSAMVGGQRGLISLGDADE